MSISRIAYRDSVLMFAALFAGLMRSDSNWVLRSEGTSGQAIAVDVPANSFSLGVQSPMIVIRYIQGFRTRTRNDGFG